jgi:hypothetical protein
MLLSLLLFALSAEAAPKKADLRVTRSPQLFMMDVARYCVSNSDSKIEQIVGGVRVYEEPACAAELKKIARAWDKAAGAVGIHVAIERHGVVKKGMAEEFQGVEYLYETSACPCLIFKGPRAREWADAAQSISVQR